MSEQEIEWPALESDPKIFTDYFHKIGASDDVKFIELLSLDYKEFIQIGGPVLGVILNFSRKNKKPIDETKIKPIDYIDFYMKQTPKLDNACGLIAGLHTLGNIGHLTFKEGSFLRKFYSESKGKNNEEIAKALEQDNACKEVHNEFANEGQTNVKEVKNVGHYVTFIFKDGEIIEVDGMKKGPYVIKEGIQADNFVDEVTKEIMRRVQDQEINEQISVMLCVDQFSNVINFLEEDF